LRFYFYEPLPLKNDKNILDTILKFLHSIEIPVKETALTEATFLPGLQIKGTTIMLDREKLKYPGDLLHEAGHIAVSDREVRPQIGSTEMAKDWPSNGEEIAAILWSYAASNHLGLDLNIVFHPNGYKNESAWLMEQFTNQNYLGLPLLEWMSLCKKEEFPIMRKWVRD